MFMAKKQNLIGSWAFLIGVILAVIFGMFELNIVVMSILVVLGLIIGLLNIADKEAQPFLLAGAVLVIVAALGGSVLNIIPVVGKILNALLALFVPATIIVALKSVFALSRK